MSLKVYKSSAGSGKTYTLVIEYLSLVLKQPSLYRNILAVTFTNKAANEMKHRVLQALWVLSGTSEKDQKLRNSLISNLKQLNNIDDATIKKNAGIVFSSIIHRYSDFSISTIDSFAHRLVRTFTRDLNLPSQFEIELSSENLANRVVDILLSEVGNDAFITETILSFVMHKMELETAWQVDRDLKNFTQKLFREEAFLYSRNNAIIDEADIKFAKELILNEINRHETYIKQIASTMLDILTSQQIQPYDLFKGKAGIGNVIIRLSKGEMKEVFTQKTLITYFDPETPYIKKSDTVQLQTAFSAIESQIIEQMHLLKNFYESEFQRFILLTLLKKHIHSFALQSQILEIVKKISNENLIVHISEFNKSIAQLLQNAVVPYIYERLGERFSHFLLDEFQDTSILQWQNFLPLIENSLANGNTNLIVGDGKQSIYRFRSGEVEQFLCLPEIYKKESSEALHRIESLLKEHYDFKNLNTNYRSAPEIVEFNSGFFDFLKERLAESMQSVFDEQRQNPIKEMGQGQISITFIEKNDNKKDELQHLESILICVEQLVNEGYAYRDIAILVRSNKDGNLAARFLAANNIGVVSADSLLLGSSEKVRLIVNAMRFSTHPEDKINRTELLYNFYKVVGSIENNNFEFELNRLNSLSEPEQIAEIVQRIGVLDFKASGLGVYDISENLLRQLNLNQLADPYIQFFLDEVHRFQLSERKGVEEFLLYWDELKSKSSVVVPEETNAVKIMTIHKAKGLEFPVVIFPFADSKKSGMTQKDAWIDLREQKLGALDYGIIPFNADLKLTVFGDLYDKEDARTQLDIINLLYVAMTRPIERLYIFSTQPKESDNSFSYPVFFRDYLIQLGIYNLDQHTYEIVAMPIGKKHIRQEVPNPFNRQLISTDWRNRLMIANETAPVLNNSTENDALLWGILLHKILSEIIYTNDNENVLIKYFENGMLSNEQIEKLRMHLLKLFLHPLVSPCFQKDVLVRNETEIMDGKGNVFRIDRFSDLGDQIVLIDYKTGVVNEVHTVQMRQYLELVRELESKPVKGYLIYMAEQIDVLEVV